MENQKYIRLGHGSGGKLTHDLVTSLFLNYFDNEILAEQGDAGLFPLNRTDAIPAEEGRPGSVRKDAKESPAPLGRMAFSTDAYVVDPIFFPGGNIGTLAVSGTVNDLAVTGADPRYLSAAFIIEEGLSLDDLEVIVRDMAAVAREAGVLIIAGDTKVVNKGKCDKIFITTAGVGFLEERLVAVSDGRKIRPGDKIILNGFAGDHGVAILGEREALHFRSPVTSDAACLNGLIKEITSSFDVHFMRDATRGGVATVLAELAGILLKNKEVKSGPLPSGGRKVEHTSDTGLAGITIREEAIPIREEVKGVCEVFGYDPLYMANEGKVVMVVPGDQATAVLEKMRLHPLGKESAIIGSVVEGEHPGKVVLHTEIGGKRFLDMLAGEQLPRIC